MVRRQRGAGRGTAMEEDLQDGRVEEEEGEGEVE
jgi:hypothetical protein